MKIQFNDKEIVELRIQTLLKICLLILLLNNLLLFGIGLYVGNQIGAYTAESVYEAKLIMRDFNITRVCYENISDIIRIGQYNDEGLKMFKTLGTIKEQFVCTNKTWNNTVYLP